MKKYPDHAWIRSPMAFIAQTSFGRSASLWKCVRCGSQLAVAGKQFPTLQDVLNQGVHLNCDVMFVAHVMLS